MSSLIEAVPEIVEDTFLDEAREPPHQIIIHNDDVTPMDFVVAILMRIFALTFTDANHVMTVAHIKGIAHVATMSLKEAQKKVGKAHFAASLEGYPLLFTIEPE